MKQIFPNIEVFGSVSKIPQHTEFYVSFMWIWGIIFVFFYFWFIIFIQIPIFKKGISTKTFLSAFPIIILGLMMINEYYFGLMGQKEIGFGARRFFLNFNTKFNDFWWITFFQMLFAVSCWGVMVGITIISLKIKNIKNKI